MKDKIWMALVLTLAIVAIFTSSITIQTVPSMAVFAQGNTSQATNQTGNQTGNQSNPGSAMTPPVYTP